MKKTVQMKWCRRVCQFGALPVMSAVLLLAGTGRTMADTGTAASGSVDTAKAVDTAKSVEMAAQSQCIWEQKYLTGDWGGHRTDLENKGVTFDLNYINDLQSDLTGNQTHHITNFGRIRGSVTIDLQKMANFDGKFFVTGMWQFGKNIGAGLNTFTSPSSIAGYNSFRLDEAWYEQGLLDHKIRVKVGQIAAVNDFGQTGLFLMNDETGYSPNITFYPLQPFSPAGKPGVVLTFDPSGKDEGIYIKGGAFTAYDNAYKPDTSGLNWGDDFDHGAAGTFEIGYNEKTAYPAVYKLGVSFSDLSRYSDLQTGEPKQGNFTAYFTYQKTVWRPALSNGKLNMDRGLDVLVQALGAPEDRNPIRFEGLLGAVYNGPFESRPQDKVGLGVIFADAGSALSSANKHSGAPGTGSLGTQVALELSYQYNPAPWFSIQPDLQYIVNPVGPNNPQSSNRDSILIIGLRTVLRF
jgi:porin